METVINKKRLVESVKAAVGAAYADFNEKPDEPRSCSVAVVEDLEESGARGKWTETVREIVRSCSPSATCVCVKPLPNRENVWYTIDVA